MSKDKYFFFHGTKNPDYFSGLVNPTEIGAPSFLSNISDNSEKQKPNFSDRKNDIFWVKTEPRWQYELVNTATGEIVSGDDFKQAYKRKARAINKFAGAYAKRYYHRTVTLLFHTLTAVNLSNYEGIAPFIDVIKYRYSLVNREMLGYVWVLECSENYHVHYHLATAINRLQVKKIPEQLKLEGVWGARTGVEFVHGDPYSYLQKKGMYDYIRKKGNLHERYQIRKQNGDVDPREGGRLKVMRMFGKSKTFR